MDDKQRRGRDLAVLSFAIIVYVWAGGSISGDGKFSLLGGSFTLQNINIVRGAIFAVFVYYWFRLYAIYPLFLSTNEKLNQSFNRYSFLRNQIGRLSVPQLNEKLDYEVELDLDSEKDASIRLKTFSSDVDEYFSWYSASIPVDIGHIEKGSFKPIKTIMFPLNWWKHKLYLLKYFFKEFMKSSTYLDYIFPHFLAIIASGFIIYRAVQLYA